MSKSKIELAEISTEQHIHAAWCQRRGNAVS